MAFMINKLNDPCGIIFLTLLTLPLIAANNIDCNGKPFHCVNSTHFMICVDLGSGVSGTLDDFVIPCPPTTVCQSTNRFECEFPTTPTQAPPLLETIAVQTTNTYQATEVSQNVNVNDQTTNIPESETVTIPFEEYYNTVSTTTLSVNEVNTPMSKPTTDSSITDVFEIINNTTFGNHANLETAGSGATHVFTTEPQITQTELLQTTATATNFTTVVTEAFTNLDTVTTPVNDVSTNKFEITTNAPYLTTIIIEDVQNTQPGDMLNTSLSTQTNDQSQTNNTTQETTASNDDKININGDVTTEKNQLVTDLVATVTSTQINEITETVPLIIIHTNFTTTMVTEPAIELTTEEVLLSSTGVQNNKLATNPNDVIAVTGETSTTTEFHTVTTENIVIVTESSTEPMPQTNIVRIEETKPVMSSTLSPITDSAASKVGNVIITDLNNSGSPNTLPNVDSTSSPTSELLLTSSYMTTPKSEVTATGSNTISNTSVSTQSSSQSVNLIESSTVNYEVTNSNIDKTTFESNLNNYVTQTPVPVVSDKNIDLIYNVSEHENQIQNETLLVVDETTPIETITVTENSSPVLLNVSKESFHINTEPTQHSSLGEVYSTPNLLVTTSQYITVQTLASEDGTTNRLPNTESVHFGDESDTKTVLKPELNEKIAHAAKDEILTTMSLQSSAVKPLELTTATNILNRETVTNIESSTDSQVSFSASDKNNSTQPDSISQKTSQISLTDNIIPTSTVEGTIEPSTVPAAVTEQNAHSQNVDVYTTIASSVIINQSQNIPVVTESLTSTDYHTSSVSNIDNSYDVPIITIATPSADKTNLKESVTLYIPIKISNTLITEIPTTVLPINDNNDVVNIDNKSYNTNQAGNAIESIANFPNNRVEQDIRIVPSLENNITRLDNALPMTNSETLSYITEPVQSYTEASPVISSTLSNNPLSGNVLDRKYKNVIVENNSNSTPVNVGLESTTAPQIPESKIFVEYASVNVNVSTPISELKLTVDNSVTMSSVQSNKDNNVMNKNPTPINDVVLENTANNYSVISDLNNVAPTETAQSNGMSSPSKQDERIITNHNIPKDEGILIKNQTQKQFGNADDQLKKESELYINNQYNTMKIQLNDTASSLTVNTNKENETGFKVSVQTAKVNQPTTMINKVTEIQAHTEHLNTSNKYDTSTVKSIGNVSNSSNKSPGITIINTIDSKTVLESATLNRTMFTLSPSVDSSSNKTSISNGVDDGIVSKNTAHLTKNITRVSNSNNPTETISSSILSVSPKHQDKTLTDLNYNDVVNSPQKPKTKVFDIKKTDNSIPTTIINRQNTTGQLDNEYETTNVKPNDSRVSTTSTTLNIDDEEKAERKEEKEEELSESPYSPTMNGGNVELSSSGLYQDVSTRAEPIEAAESNNKNIPQSSKREQLSTPISSISVTTQPNVTPKIINLTPRTVATTAKPVVTQFLCNPFLRGRFADNHDCRKFYICIGRPLPMAGFCPNNTVFSEIRKQCTKNLSHCVRNNQFQCVSEGRFSDFLNDNIYYICAKNKLNHFIRFKLRCQNGYHLNKTSVRCVLNTETFQSISISDKSISDQSGPLARLKKKPVSRNFECEKEGKFADPNDCRTYYVCKIGSDSEFRRKTKKCDSDEIFHNDKKKCVDAESYECNS